jgi:hypothetical protein
MGLRFRRSIKIAPGVRLNVSKSGVSTTIGPRGAKVTIGGKGGTRTTVGIPGTGLSYTEQQRRKHGAPQEPRSGRSALFIIGAIIAVAVVIRVFGGG